MVIVNLALATICFANNCYPALMGNNTPAGIFPLTQMRTSEPGYGGDFLVYQEDRQHVWAIHRVWTLKPEERRIERLASHRAELRRSITNGCINVMPAVYRKLVDCCSKDALLIVDDDAASFSRLHADSGRGAASLQ
jgi:hypothetical protein